MIEPLLSVLRDLVCLITTSVCLPMKLSHYCESAVKKFENKTHIIEMTLSHTTHRYKLYSAFQPHNALCFSNVVCSYCNFDEYTVKA